MIEGRTVIQADEIVEVMGGTAADCYVVLLRNGILFGQDAHSRCFVEFDRSAEVLLGAKAHVLTLFQGHIREYVDFKRTSESFVFFFYEHS
jgi:hypothetical protein